MNKRVFILLTMGVSLLHQITLAQQLSSTAVRALIDSALKNNTNRKMALQHMKAAGKLFQLSKTSYIPDVLEAAGANTLADMDYAMNSATADLVVRSTRYDNAYTCLNTPAGRKNIPACIACTVVNEYSYLLDLDTQLSTARHNMLSADSMLIVMTELLENNRISEDAVRRVVEQRLVAGYLLPAIEKHIGWQENGLSILAGVETDNIPRDRDVDFSDVKAENCDG